MTRSHPERRSNLHAIVGQALRDTIRRSDALLRSAENTIVDFMEEGKKGREIVPETDPRSRRMIDFKNFDDWTEERIHPVVLHSVRIFVAVFICFAVFEYILDGHAPNFIRSIPLRAVAFAALILMLVAQKATSPGAKRVLLTLFFGLVCQMTMVYVYIFLMDRVEYAPFMILYFFFGILLIAPALDLRFFICQARTKSWRALASLATYRETWTPWCEPETNCSMRHRLVAGNASRWPGPRGCSCEMARISGGRLLERSAATDRRTVR